MKESAARSNMRSRQIQEAVFILWASVCLVLASSCRPQPAARNFILITLDTQRADHIGAYNPGGTSTPAIDSVAAAGILFENCHSPIPITLPAHASIFYSRAPHSVPNYNNGQIVVPARGRVSMAERFRAGGYATAAFVSLGVLASRFGLDRGFDLYEDRFPEGRWYLDAGQVNERVFPWLEANAKRRFFCWIHYSDPHDPYSPPDLPDDLTLILNGIPVESACLSRYETRTVRLSLKPGRNTLRFRIVNNDTRGSDLYKGRLDVLRIEPGPGENGPDIVLDEAWFAREDGVFFFSDDAIIKLDSRPGSRTVTLTYRGNPVTPPWKLRAMYRREVEYMDGQLGRLLEKIRQLGLEPSTGLLIAGDHGEGLGEYRTGMGDPHFGHIHFLNEVYLRVPLILSVPAGKKAGLRVSRPASLIDISPTLLRLMRLPSLPGAEGLDLLVDGPDGGRRLWQETFRPESVADRFGLLSYPWHLIVTPSSNACELYDLQTDPEERRNLYDSEASDPVLGRLRPILDDRIRRILSEKKEIPLDKSSEEILRSLGYIR